MEHRIFNRKYLSLLGLTLIVYACAENKPPAAETADTKQAFILEKQEVGKTLQIPAELLPFEQADIHARVEAFVQRVAVDIGDRVSRGQVLAMLDAPEAAAKYAEATAKHQEAEARYRVSQDRFSRIREAAREAGTIAESELVSAKNQMLADSAALLSAQSTARAYRQLENYLTIRAPFTGIITRRNANPGDLVGPNLGNALFSLERTDKFRLHVHVPEAYTASAALDTIPFSVDAYAERTFAARLARKSGSINPETRTELWEYEYDNNTGTLKPGMYTAVQLRLNRPAASFVVPGTAVATTMERKFVIRVRNGKAEWVDVRPGIATDGGVELFGDLAAGDTLLVRGSDEIRPDSEVGVTFK